MLTKKTKHFVIGNGSGSGGSGSGNSACGGSGSSGGDPGTCGSCTKGVADKSPSIGASAIDDDFAFA